MSDPKKKTPLERIASFLEAAQFNNGSLDITLQGPETDLVGCPLKVVIYLQGQEVEKLRFELASMSEALHAIADAIRGRQRG